MTKSKTHDIELFRIPGEGLFLASANQGRDRSRDSSIYKWDENSRKFISFQNITTDTARDWEYFSIEDEVSLNFSLNNRSDLPKGGYYRRFYFIFRLSFYLSCRLSLIL